MTEMNAETERPVPAWVGIAVVVLCLACGGGFLYWYMRDPLPSAGELIPDAGRQTVRTARAAPRRQAPVVAVNPDGIKTSSTGKGWTVRAGTSTMDVEPSFSGAMTYAFRYLRNDLLTPDQRSTFMVRFRLTQDQAVVQELKVTPDQLKKLNDIPRTGKMEVSADDQKKLSDLFDSWKSASGSDKAAKEKEVIRALADLGNRSVDATKARIASDAAQITTILTPQQIKQFQDMSNGATP